MLDALNAATVQAVAVKEAVVETALKQQDDVMQMMDRCAWWADACAGDVRAGAVAGAAKLCCPGMVRTRSVLGLQLR